MKTTKHLTNTDKRMMKALSNEARSNDGKIMVYPYHKRVTISGKISFQKEWHVMKEGHKTSRKFSDKATAMQFASKMSKGMSEKLFVSAK